MDILHGLETERVDTSLAQFRLRYDRENIMDDGYDAARRELGTERVDTFLANFGIGPAYDPAPAVTYLCTSCGAANAQYREEGADCDGGQNQIVLHCPDCGFTGEE